MSISQFVSNARYVWVECDVPGYEGFRAEVRQNLTQGERTALREQLAEIEERIDEVQETSMRDAQDLDEQAQAPNLTAADHMRLRVEQRKMLDRFNRAVEDETQRQHELIAPHIRAWNLYRSVDGGEPQPIAAPATAGVAVFEDLDRPLIQWLVREVLMAYRGGKGLSVGSTKSSEQPAPTPEPTRVGPQVTDMSDTRTSRRKSSGQ